jgi:hypothetical protein
MAVGAAVVGRWLPPQRRIPATGLLAVLGGLPLLGCAARPSIPITIVLVGIAGFCCSYNLLAATAFVRATPIEVRASAIGIASSVVLTSQGIGTFVFGVAADHLGAAVAIAVAGGAAVTVALLLSVALGRAWSTSGRDGIAADS